jgi:hypothetical protein
MLYTKNANVTTTAVSTLVTIPNGYVAHWTMLYISNLASQNNHATVYVDKSDGTTLNLIDGYTISNKNFLLFSDAVLVLQPEDVIMCSTQSAGNVEFVVTIDLLYQQAAYSNFSGA